MSDLYPMNMEEWRQKGAYYDINGQRVFAIDHQPDDKRAICILHGYPSASIDYYKCLPFFTNSRVVVHDHLGFGFSDKPVDHDYLLVSQADAVIQLWQKLGIEKLHIIAHDYGTSIATELIARQNEDVLDIEIQSCNLCNGSMLIDMAKLRPIQRLLKNRWLGPVVAQLATRETFARNMRKIFHDPKKISIHEIDVLWEMLTTNGGRKVLPAITRYIDERFTHYDRWIGALGKTSIPILVLWGENDPVAVVEMAYRLYKKITNSKLSILTEVGHYPMLEDSERWTGEILGFLDALQ